MKEFYEWLIIEDNIKNHTDTWNIIASHYYFNSVLFKNKSEKLKNILSIAEQNNITIPNYHYSELLKIRKCLIN